MVASWYIHTLRESPSQDMSEKSTNDWKKSQKMGKKERNIRFFIIIFRFEKDLNSLYLESHTDLMGTCLLSCHFFKLVSPSTFLFWTPLDSFPISWLFGFFYLVPALSARETRPCLIPFILKDSDETRTKTSDPVSSASSRNVGNPKPFPWRILPRCSTNYYYWLLWLWAFLSKARNK